MGIIYLITNDLNDKKYVGLTTRDLEFRWKEHCRHSSQSIDSAITKYGKHHFHISILEDCPEDKLDEREQYWIKYYDSFNNGYNLTNGGRGSNFIKNPDKVKEVKELWDLGHGQKSITKLTKLNVETVHSYLLKSGVTKEDIKDRHRLLVGASKSKPILQFDENDFFIKEWESQAQLIRTGIICKSTLTRCLKDPNKIFNGYKYKYKEIEGKNEGIY